MIGTTYLICHGFGGLAFIALFNVVPARVWRSNLRLSVHGSLDNYTNGFLRLRDLLCLFVASSTQLDTAIE
jgi:hypothetical protein